MNIIRADFGVAVQLAGGSVLPIRHIIGIGRNYAEHAKEQGAAVPDRPMIFTKNPASACLSGDDIVIPKICQDQEQVDWEGELAIIIGKPARDVSEKDASDARSGIVLGYAVANDVSARWWQKTGSGGQFCRGKSFDTFCPVGPRVTAAADVGDPGKLGIRTTVSGEVMQSGSTADMVFSCAYLVAELSRGTTLMPGTMILTGTPSGVGMSRTPPRFLREGDVVRIEIDGLGAIENRVRLER
jgi:2-keto-4-pentenoate hydratase/2-oxohepta-3-ene-1,7-dioic acid hydratase in catechol pathway